jgi:type VI secretion system protein ImpF
MNTRRSQQAGRGAPLRAQMPLLDRLIDDAPDALQDPPEFGTDSADDLRRSVQRDLEALLNARRRWRSWPDHYSELAVSPVGYGIADFAAGSFNDPRQRDQLRARIEQTIHRFEPRLTNIRVTLVDAKDTLEATLNLRITAMLLIDPAPELIAFNTKVDATTTEVTIRPGGADPSPSDV